MRIGVDLDGVLADLHGPFARQAQRLFPSLDPGALGAPEVGASPDTSSEDARDGLRVLPATQDVGLTADQSRAVWRSLTARQNFWETLRECEAGAVARLASLADTRGWEVLFITSRPASAGRIVQRQSQRWLRRHGFDMPSVFVVKGSRGRIAAALHLDVIVDDRPDNCLDVVLESKAGAVLIWRGDAGAVPVSAKRFGIATAPTVSECLDKLVAAEEAGAATAFMDQLRRLFGLKVKRPGIAHGLMSAPSRKGKGTSS